MAPQTAAAQHDAYAVEYDRQMQAYHCYLPEILFGLCYEFTRPGQVLLDVGIGSGLAAQLFAKAGLAVYGMDFAATMLAICRDKGFAHDLRQHDLQQIPWPYLSNQFDQLVCCGVLHFIADLAGMFGEAGRVLRAGGLLAFTTKVAPSPTSGEERYQHQESDGFAIYAHTPAYIDTLLAQQACTCLKRQQCFVGDERFMLWVVQKD